MRVRMVWGWRPGPQDGNGHQLEPEAELMVAWDEYAIEGNEDGWTAAVQEATLSWGSDLLFSRDIDIDIPDEVFEALAQPTLLTAKVAKPKVASVQPF